VPIDPSVYVAPTARVDADATIGPQCRVGEFCVVESDVVLGRGCHLEPHVYVKRWTTLGNDNHLSAGVVLGSDPLDKAFQGERSYLSIGDRNRIREHFTISRGTKPEAVTRIGNDNFIMTSGHIAHDCQIGDGVVVASCALVAGYASVDDGAFLSGGVVVHQYTRIGQLAMVGGNTRVNTDLPPFFLYSEFHAAAHGLNVVGLRRAGVTQQEMRDLKLAYRILYRSNLSLSAALEKISTTLEGEKISELVRFIEDSKRGIGRPSTRSQREPSLHG
jgi:UDP-N-acetylglucosamine acyltransferase